LSNATQRWRLDLAYDGDSFNGFAYQPGDPTVVGLLRSTLQTTLQLPEPPLITGAGRTDTGVHAFAQVVHVDLPEPLFPNVRGPEDHRLMVSLNAQMRGLVRVHRAQRVSSAFHARYSAQWREYRYLILETQPPALNSSTTWAWPLAGPLDLEAMNRSAQDILGEHDFRAFCKRSDKQTPEDPIVRRVLAARWERLSDPLELAPEGAPVVKLTIRGQSFCHNMVRCLTSTMAQIGQGKIPENTIAERLLSHSRFQLPPPAPPQGLSLVGVGYEEFAGGVAGFLR